MPDNRGRHNVKAVHAFEAEISVGGGDTVTVWSHAREAPVRYFYDLTGDVGAGASIRTEGNSQREMVPALEGNADRKNLVQVAGENQCRARWLGRSRRGGAPRPTPFALNGGDAMANPMPGDHPDLKMVNPNAAAIDIGSTMRMAAVNPDADSMPVRALHPQARPPART